MNSKKVHLILLGILGLAFIGVLASFYLANHSLESDSQKLVKLKLDNKVLDEQQIALVQANKDISKYADLEQIAKTIVPQDKDQARVVREITNLAVDSGIPIQSISFPTSNLGQSRIVAGGSTTTATPSSSSVKSTPSQLKPVTGITGLYQLEVTVQSETTKPVTFDQLINFLSKLEQNRRTAQVTGITVTPNSNNRKLITFSLILNVYIKP
jgi:hypothetical protein